MWATWLFSYASWLNNTASWIRSNAQGQSNTASWDSSHAEWNQTNAIWDSSHSEWLGTTANWNSSHAEWFVTTAQNANQHSAWKYNIWTSPDTIHETGIWSFGESWNIYKNAFEIYTNWRVRVPELTVALHDNPRSVITKEYWDLNYIDKTTNETVWWVKTFTSSPIVPTPTTDFQTATKKYVDDNAGWWWWGWFIRWWEFTDINLWILSEWQLNKASTLDFGWANVKVAPTWADIIIEVSKSSDSWATYWTAQTITIVAWTKDVISPLTLVFVAWDWLKLEVTQVWSLVVWSGLAYEVTWS